MLTIYHSPLSRSMRVVWLCEELNIAYRVVSLEMFSAAMQEPEYLEISPLGKVPAIDDNGFVLWETTAIMEYLVAKYSDGSLIPPRDTPSGAKTIQWMDYGENPLTVVMGEIVAHGGALPEERRIPALVERGQSVAVDYVNVVEQALGDHSYILPEGFTAADIMLGFGLNIAMYLGYVDENTPRCKVYLEHLMGRSSYQRAVLV